MCMHNFLALCQASFLSHDVYIFWSLVSGCRLFLLSRDCAHPSSHHFQIASSLGEPLEVEPSSRLTPVVDCTFWWCDRHLSCLCNCFRYLLSIWFRDPGGGLDCTGDGLSVTLVYGLYIWLLERNFIRAGLYPRLLYLVW